MVAFICHAPRRRGIQYKPNAAGGSMVPPCDGGGYWIARMRGR
jgi:hypothetical protein